MTFSGLFVRLFVFFVLFGSAACDVQRHRWVKEGTTDDEVRRALQECMEKVALELEDWLPSDQYTSTRYWERSPPPTRDSSDLERLKIRQCMEEKAFNRLPE